MIGLGQRAIHESPLQSPMNYTVFHPHFPLFRKKGTSVKNKIFTRVWWLSLSDDNDFSRDYIAFKTQPQFPKERKK